MCVLACLFLNMMEAVAHQRLCHSNGAFIPEGRHLDSAGPERVEEIHQNEWGPVAIPPATAFKGVNYERVHPNSLF